MLVATWLAIAGAALALVVSLATWRGLRVALTRMAQTEPARVVTEVARLGGVARDLAAADETQRSELETLLRSDHAKLAEGILGFEKGLQALKLDVETQMQGHQAKLVSWRSDVEAVLDSVEDILDRTERKRGSAAAYESRRKKAEAEKEEAEAAPQPINADTATLDQLRQLARSRGIEVM